MFNFRYLTLTREVPMELIRESRGREVHLQMEDHRTEEFISKKMHFKVTSFSGKLAIFLMKY